MKSLLQSFIFLFCASAFAQPFVLSCDLNTEFIRDKIIDPKNSGVWCKACAVAITVEKKNVLSLANVDSEVSYFYNTNNKVDLDSNGFGWAGTWSVDEQAIKAYNRIYQYNKDVGYTILNINRLTGRFYATSTIVNPIGKGNVETTLSGACKSKKAAF
ncbi:hypothetical protein [Limnohabitans sp. T6-20]|uniref:hypothetical protein n=1 Tax=Limnohabitans sp. T6-20 TaxID=1100725 RepID=UPI0011B2214E|nr:hypothetical protein [Limnohabitans sp. T6-20]